MKMKRLLLVAAGIAIGTTGALESKTAYSADLFFPHTVYRTGAYASSGIPSANGFRDYYALLNKRDGGIEGHKVVSEECEFKYNTKIGVECYEKLKKCPCGAKNCSMKLAIVDWPEAELNPRGADDVLEVDLAKGQIGTKLWKTKKGRGQGNGHAFTGKGICKGKGTSKGKGKGKTKFQVEPLAQQQCQKDQSQWELERPAGFQ